MIFLAFRNSAERFAIRKNISYKKYEASIQMTPINHPSYWPLFAYQWAFPILQQGSSAAFLLCIVLHFPHLVLKDFFRLLKKDD